MILFLQDHASQCGKECGLPKSAFLVPWQSSHLKITRQFDVHHPRLMMQIQRSVRNFGQKLKRFKHIEEEEKENDFWWMDAISYG
jgi:hypothetical protein